MLKTKTLGLLMIGALLSPAVHASTINELVLKSQQLLQLEADIAIARKQAELAEALSGKPDSKAGRSRGEMGAEGPTLEAPPRLRAAPVKMAPPTEAEDFKVYAIRGDVHNPVVEVLYQDSKLNRKQGETVAAGWVIKSVVDNEVTFAKVQQKTEHKVVKYLTSDKSNKKVGRDIYPVVERTPSPENMMLQQLPPPPMNIGK